MNEPEPDVRTQLERVRLSLAEQQWDEAVESLRKIMENHGERMVRLDDRRFMPLREYCHILLRGLPPEGLAIYRGRVDAQANEWLDEGLRRRNRSQLQRVVDELFASSHTDEALLALGEIALERGEFGAARGYWERISPKLRADAAMPLWLQQREQQAAKQKRSSAAGASAQPAAWLAYPDANLNLADVCATRVSVDHGRSFRAPETELETFLADHPDAQGRLAGREAPYQKTLAALLSAAKAWPSSPRSTAPTTFGGTPDRNYVADRPFRLRRLLWSIPFLESWQANTELSQAFLLPNRRVAESAQGVLSYHPLVVGELVVLHDLHRVYVYNLRTGKPAWPRTDQQGRPGEVSRVSQIIDANGHPAFSRTLGVPRFAPTVDSACVLTMHESTEETAAKSPCYLFVRLGSHITSRPTGSRQSTPGEIPGARPCAAGEKSGQPGARE